MYFLLFPLFLLQPCNCDSFTIRDNLSRSLHYSPPPKHVSPRLKFSVRGAWNEATKAEVFSAFDEGEEIEDIIDEVGIGNIFRFNFRVRYRYPKGNKIYLGDMLRGSTHIPYIGIVWTPGSKATWRLG